MAGDASRAAMRKEYYVIAPVAPGKERAATATVQTVELQVAAQCNVDEIFKLLDTSNAGLSSREATLRSTQFGPNALHVRSTGPFDVLIGQLKNPLLGLLAATAIVALVLHDRTDAVIILGIVVLSVGLGFLNEYRSVRAIADLRAHVRQTARALRDGKLGRIDATALVPGDIVALEVGDIVPADLRLLEMESLACDEAMLTGESMPAQKSVAPPGPDAGGTQQTCAMMGTVVRAGSGRGVVFATGARTELGGIAARVGAGMPETAFQAGLRGFSGLLVWITAVAASIVFVVNAILRHAVLEPLLFALAIAVSLTPQLLPAIVTISLATGARRMAKRSVLVKRLVSIEDLGNMTVLFTDKTGTLTDGRMTLRAALDTGGAPSAEVLQLGLLCTAGGRPDGADAHGSVTGALDAALWASAESQSVGIAGWSRIAQTPFDYERRLMSVLVDDGTRRRIVTKGAPESVLARCATVPRTFEAILQAQFAAGARVIAVATRDAPGLDRLAVADEVNLVLAGMLVFVDPPKADAAASLARLERLGIRVKIITGDNELVAQKVCADLGLTAGATLTGTAIAHMNDTQLASALAATAIFARVSPEQKARLVNLQRAAGTDVGFLGDGVNDAVALHDADVGISVDTAADVAKDAADIVLVTKDLGLLADGVVEGRRIFANTIKYVLMGTSSNFGNMLSTAAGSMFLPFLPLLPSQILLNNLLYDVSEMTIPTDNVDDEQLQRPAHWDIGFIRRFMLVFGPLSAIVDMSLFAIMIGVFSAGPALFRSGFFVESFVTQTLIIFAIRTRRVPFFRSRASRPLTLATLGVAIVGAGLPFVPGVGAFFGFVPLPPAYFGLLAVLVSVYVIVIEIAKRRFFARRFPDAR